MFDTVLKGYNGEQARRSVAKQRGVLSRGARANSAEGCPYTVERLNEAGVETIEIPYDEVHKNGGSIHCSTLPLLRDPD